MKHSQCFPEVSLRGKKKCIIDVGRFSISPEQRQGQTIQDEETERDNRTGM